MAMKSSKETATDEENGPREMNDVKHKPVVDLVFIRGVTGVSKSTLPSESCWDSSQSAVGDELIRNRPSYSSKGDSAIDANDSVGDAACTWLRSALPKDLPAVRILTYGQDANTFKAQMREKTDITPLADRFLESLKLKRENGGLPKRAIVFLGHGLGGAVAEDALMRAAKTAREGPCSSCASIFEATEAIIPLGYPAPWKKLSRKTDDPLQHPYVQYDHDRPANEKTKLEGNEDQYPATRCRSCNSQIAGVQAGTLKSLFRPFYIHASNIVRKAAKNRQRNVLYDVMLFICQISCITVVGSYPSSNRTDEFTKNSIAHHILSTESETSAASHEILLHMAKKMFDPSPTTFRLALFVLLATTIISGIRWINSANSEYRVRGWIDFLILWQSLTFQLWMWGASMNPINTMLVNLSLRRIIVASADSVTERRRRKQIDFMVKKLRDWAPNVVVPDLVALESGDVSQDTAGSERNNV